MADDDYYELQGVGGQVVFAGTLAECEKYLLFEREKESFD